MRLAWQIGLAAAMMVGVAACGDSSRERTGGETRESSIPATTFRITIENIAADVTLAADVTAPVVLSPGAYAIHEGGNALYRPGEDADAALERLAEDGNEAPKATELADQIGVFESGAFNTPAGAGSRRPIRPGERYVFTVQAGFGERLSFATMFGNTNDLFFGPDDDGIPLFRADTGAPVRGDVTNQILLWDAGTEINQAPNSGPDTALRQPAPNTGEDEGEVIRLIQDVHDGFVYPAVSKLIRVTIEPL